MNKYTSEIFEILRRGQFICSNSPDDAVEALYKILDDEHNFEQLAEYFSAINYILEKGNEYFYFTRKENKADLERKLEKVFHWIDIIDFFKTYDQSFSSGFRFTPSQIANQLGINADLKTKLDQLKKVGADKKNYLDRIKKIIEQLVKDNYVALENELTETYKVLSSFHYLENLIDTINIPEDIANEIPE